MNKRVKIQIHAKIKLGTLTRTNDSYTTSVLATFAHSY